MKTIIAFFLLVLFNFAPANAENPRQCPELKDRILRAYGVTDFTYKHTGEGFFDIEEKTGSVRVNGGSIDGIGKSLVDIEFDINCKVKSIRVQNALGLYDVTPATCIAVNEALDSKPSRPLITKVQESDAAWSAIRNTAPSSVICAEGPTPEQAFQPIAMSVIHFCSTYKDHWGPPAVRRTRGSHSTVR